MTNLTRKPARLLDPAGGDDHRHPDRRLRLDLRRVELIGIFTILVCSVEGVFSFWRGIDGYLASCVMGGIIAVGFIGIARWGQRNDPARLRYLPEVFITFVLLASLTLCVMIAMHGKMQWGLALVYFACAIIFLIPPRRFAAIGLGIFTLFIVTTFIAPVSTFEKFDAIFNTAMAFGFGTLGRWGIDRLQKKTETQVKLIEEQNARLAKQNEELNSLMAIAAHDLRSPLLGLRNLLQLASERPPSNRKSWDELLSAAGSGIDSMQHLIARVLQAHEVEIGAVWETETVNLSRTAQKAILRHTPTALKNGINLKAMHTEPNVVAIANEDALQQVLDNLLSNAIRFSSRGSVVELMVGVEGGPFIEVRDEGVGLDAQARKNLFRKFGRGELRPPNGEWGSGLGLFIARELTVASGGDIHHIEREKGTGFRVSLKAV